MFYKYALMLMVVMLSGCAIYHPSVPKDYQGLTAIIEDTETRIDGGKVDLFYLSHVDGNRIENSRSRSMGRSYGQGGVLTTVLLEHPVAAIEQTFSIIGRTIYAMPARELLSTVYEVKGDVTFTPKPDVRYVIKGELTEEYSRVWVEYGETGEVVQVIEIDGPAKVGFFQ